MLPTYVSVCFSLILEKQQLFHTCSSKNVCPAIDHTIIPDNTSLKFSAKFQRFFINMRETIVMVDKSSNVPKPSKSNVKEWRLFMSPRVSNTLSSVSSSETSKMHKDQHFHDQEFSKIFKEVEKLGTSQMSWKKRKEIEVQKRVALGAKPEKGHRMPISMGLSIKRKRERLEEQKLQEDFALGRITKKWKKDTEKQTASDRGLKTSEGLFRGGVLYVKPLPQKREEKFQPSRGHGKSSKKHKKTKQKGKRKRR